MSTSLDANNKPVSAAEQAETSVVQETPATKKSGLSTLKWIIIGGIVAALLAVLLVSRFRPPEFHGVLIQAPDAATDFTMMTTTGEPMSLSDFRGKQVMLYFGYTFCPDVCPTTLNDLRAMMDELGPKKAENVQVIMVSVDPERDDVQQLSTYLPYFDESFLGMTGSLEETQKLASQFGIFFEKQEGDTAAGYLVDHTAAVTLIDDKGHVRMVFPYGTTGEDMAADLSYLMR